jgi:hypothetical protein
LGTGQFAKYPVQARCLFLGWHSLIPLDLPQPPDAYSSLLRDLMLLGI